jgi:hypothetical protein
MLCLMICEILKIVKTYCEEILFICFSRHSLGQYLFQSTPTNHYPFIKSMMLIGTFFSLKTSALTTLPFDSITPSSTHHPSFIIPALPLITHYSSLLLTTSHYFSLLLTTSHSLILHSRALPLITHYSLLAIRYIGQQLGANPPHLFAIAEDSYANLRLHDCDQSILISGESGYVVSPPFYSSHIYLKSFFPFSPLKTCLRSGKTEATKLIMQYLAAMTRKVSFP